MAYLNALNKAIDYVKVVNRRKIRKAFGVREKKKKGRFGGRVGGRCRGLFLSKLCFA